MQVLVIKPSSVGDIIHALLVIERLKLERSDVSVSWVVREEFAPLVEAAEAVDHIFLFDRHAGFSGFVSLMREVRKRKFDYVLDMQGLGRSACMTFVAKGRKRVGRRDAREFSFLAYNHLIRTPERGARQHAVEFLTPYLQCFDVDAEAAKCIRFKFAPTDHLFPDSFSQEGQLIALFPESRRAEKNWNGFGELTQQLLDASPSNRIVWCGHQPIVDDGVFDAKRFLNLTNKTHLNELPSLLERMSCVVSNDSGPMHLAAALQIPLVALFGPTDPERFGPFPRDTARQRVLTSPDGLSASITVDSVVPAVKEVVDSVPSDARKKPLVVWRILDGKAGHEAQTLGLVNALRKKVSIQSYNIAPISKQKALYYYFIGRFGPGRNMPPPDLILGAGHGTHLSMLAAKRARGGRTVLLMKPSLPVSKFDFCFIPEHDSPKQLPHVYPTVGVLNAVQRATGQSSDKALILIGGPSSHYAWDTADTIASVLEMVRTDAAVQWILTTSRRTPKDTEDALINLNEANLEIVPFADTQQGWVNARLNECATAWVTEESVSMVFEALTSGAGVGLLPVPLISKSNRVSAGIDQLKSTGRVQVYAPKATSYRVELQGGELAEADRCAAILLDELKQ
ncbi:MAG: ELM1/GtrOC1 family putative glycosyltransferase [Opitutaceae bacterium]